MIWCSLGLCPGPSSLEWSFFPRSSLLPGSLPSKPSYPQVYPRPLSRVPDSRHPCPLSTSPWAPCGNFKRPHLPAHEPASLPPPRERNRPVVQAATPPRLWLPTCGSPPNVPISLCPHGQWHTQSVLSQGWPKIFPKLQSGPVLGQ